MYPNLFIVGQDKTQLAIGAITTVDTNTVIPLSLHLPQAGSVDFNLLTTENLPYNLKGVYLIDKKTQRITRLFTGSRYNLTLEAGNYDNRFYLQFDDYDNIPEVKPINDVYYVYRENGNIFTNIKLENDRPGNLSLLNVSGRLISVQKVKGNGVYNLGNPKTAGIYVISFVTSNGLFAKKIFVTD
jgi:hypothetical protein